MLERLRSFAHAHTKLGKPMSQTQKLVLFHGSQRRALLCAISQLQVFMNSNPGYKPQVYDAIARIGAIEDALRNEYARDRKALEVHKVEVEA